MNATPDIHSAFAHLLDAVATALPVLVPALVALLYAQSRRLSQLEETAANNRHFTRGIADAAANGGVTAERVAALSEAFPLTIPGTTPTKTPSDVLRANPPQPQTGRRAGDSPETQNPTGK